MTGGFGGFGGVVVAASHGHPGGQLELLLHLFGFEDLGFEVARDRRFGGYLDHLFHLELFWVFGGELQSWKNWEDHLVIMI